MVGCSDAASLRHAGMALHCREVQAHRELLHASTVVRAELCVWFHEILLVDLVPLVAHAMAVPDAIAVPDASLHREAAVHASDARGGSNGQRPSSWCPN